MKTTDFQIRPLEPSDESFLWKMLYHALFVPPGIAPFPRDIIDQPEIRRYAEDWGKADDFALLAVNSQTQHPVGAVWIRLMTGKARGYGYVDELTPELSIAMLPDYRGLGLGTRLMTQLFEAVRDKHPALSLSVSTDNPARHLYERLGFEIVKIEGDSITMKKSLYH